MSAQRLAIAGSLAMLAMGNAVHAAAEDRTQGSALDAAAAARVADGTEATAANRSAISIDLRKSVDLGAAMAETVPPWLRARAEAEAYGFDFDSLRFGAAGDTGNSIVAYAGFGRGALKLSMDLGSGDVRLRGEKRDRRARLFLGMLYAVAPRTSLAVEYGARSSDGSAGGKTFKADTGLDDHNVLVSFQHRF
jgi:hypothetical protein